MSMWSTPRVTLIRSSANLPEPASPDGELPRHRSAGILDGAVGAEGVDDRAVVGDRRLCRTIVDATIENDFKSIAGD